MVVSEWQDTYFDGVASLFDELWGWELEGSEREKRDIADLYIAGVLLACTRLRVIREQDRTAAFLGSVLYENSPEELGLKDPAAFSRAALVIEQRLRQTKFGRDSIEFNERINEANRKLKNEMLEREFSWQGELKLLMTAPAFQGRGCARTLISESLEYMRHRGVRAVVLYTDSHCNWQYYEKTGWTLAAEHEWQFMQEPIRALAYWKAL